MQTYDLLMLAVLGGLTLYGYFKGMAWQIAYIASFVVSYFMAHRFADQIAPNITFVNPPANKFVAMLLIYAVSSFFIWMLFRIVSKMIDSVKMEGFDHQMGAIIGFIRGVLWCVGLTFFAVTLLPDSQKQRIVNSKSGHYIARLLNETETIFPPEVQQVLGPYLNRLHNELQPNGQQQFAAPGQQSSQQANQQPSQLFNQAAGAASNLIQSWENNTPQNNAPQGNAWQNENWQNSWGQSSQAPASQPTQPRSPNPAWQQQQQPTQAQPTGWPAW